MPLVFRHSPFITRSATFWPFIFLASSQADRPEILAHEQAHYDRQAWWSPAWVVIYLLSKSFRFREEKIGYAAQIAYCRKNGWAGAQSLYDIVLDMTTEYDGMCTVDEAWNFVNAEFQRSA